MRYLTILGLFLACLAWPALAQDPTPAQLERQRALLQRFGSRLSAWNEEFHLVDKLTALASDEQLSALKAIKVTPAQRTALLNVLRDSMASGDATSLRKTLSSKMVDILGVDQSDLFLELVPSPQQIARAEAILKDAAASSLGNEVYATVTDLSSSLTPAQHTWLDPVLTRIKKPAVAQPTPPQARVKTAPAKGERRLVMMRSNSLGDYYAEIRPDFDYTVAMPRTYRVKGDPAVLAGVSNADGLPVRLLGTYGDDVIQVSTSLLGPLPITPVVNVKDVWRGRLPARVTSTSPPTVELDAGRGQLITAVLDFQNPKEQQAFEAAGQQFLLGGTCLVTADKTTMVDLDFAPWQPPSAQFPARVLIQLSEEFFDHVAQEFLEGHRSQVTFKDSSGQNSLQVTDIGATLKGCSGSQLRVFGRASATVGGLNILEGEVEGVTSMTFSQSGVNLALVPGSLQGRLTFPMYLSVPASWIANIQRILAIDTNQGYAVAIPDNLKSQLTGSGLVDDASLNKLQLFTFPSGDRRSSLVALAAPGNVTPAVDVLRTRLQAPAEFAVALSDEALNDALKKKVPPMLPIKREIPKDKQLQQGVRLTDVEIPALDLGFANGVFVINNCEVHVHWSYGLFSGVEPGVRFKGTARITGTGTPLKLVARLKIDQLDIISPRMLESPPDELKANRENLIKTMEGTDLELAQFSQFALAMISARAALQPTDVAGTTNPSELLLRGRLAP